MWTYSRVTKKNMFWRCIFEAAFTKNAAIEWCLSCVSHKHSSTIGRGYRPALKPCIELRFIQRGLNMYGVAFIKRGLKMYRVAFYETQLKHELKLRLLNAA